LAYVWEVQDRHTGYDRVRVVARISLPHCDCLTYML
jgi:hypothetical protein